LFGKDNLLLDVYNFIQNNNIFNDVIFLSNRGAILDIINCFDIAVRPSFSGDPWGRDIIEYMALSKPIIATGTSDFFIKPDISGFLVPIHDYKKIAEKIFWLMKNERERNIMGEAAFNTINDRCNMNVFQQKILNIYSSIINLNEQI
jgi:glycosyltransferase involved in cell wall biosynthesis